MIRTRTTLIVGPGAGSEVELPDTGGLLAKTVQAFDFQRLGTRLQSADMKALDAQFALFATAAKVEKADLVRGAQVIRAAARLGNSLDAILDQHSHDEMVQAAGKLAIAYFTLQAEGQSPLLGEPRDPGDLPIRGNENWLFQLGRTIVNGVPRAAAETCFDNLSIVSLSHDRAIEHFMPWLMQLAWGMGFAESRAFVAEKLEVLRPFGKVGRLPWENGEAPAAGWGELPDKTLHRLAAELHTGAERVGDKKHLTRLHHAVSGAARLIFLGYDFNAQTNALLFDETGDRAPDIYAEVHGASALSREAIGRLLASRSGQTDRNQIALIDARPWQMLRDYALIFEN